MISYLIWVPSVQDYRRFKEFKTSHQKQLSKLTDEPLEFLFALNNILKELCVDELDFKKLTLIDKYIICTYLRMRCIDTKINLSMTCPTCGATFKGNIDLNEVIENNIDILDKEYKSIITVDDYVFKCSIPTLQNEYELLRVLQDKHIQHNSIENVYSYHTLAHIESLTLRGVECSLKDISVVDAGLILSLLPLKIIKEVQTGFVTPTAEALSPSIMNIPCPTGKTCDPFELSLSLINVNDLVKLMFQESPVEILREIFYLARYGYVDSHYVEELTPKERTTMIKFIIEEKKAEKEQSEKTQSGQEMSAIGSQHGFDGVETPNGEFGF